MIQRYAQLWFFRKKSGNSFSTTFYVCFLKKSVSYILLIDQYKFHCLNDFTSWDIWQYVYCNCFFPGCDVINFEINFIFLIKLFLCITKKSRQFKYLEKKKILRWNKNYFSSLLNGFQLPKIVSCLRVCLQYRIIFRTMSKIYNWTFSEIVNSFMTEAVII